MPTLVATMTAPTNRLDLLVPEQRPHQPEAQRKGHRYAEHRHGAGATANLEDVGDAGLQTDKEQQHDDAQLGHQVVDQVDRLLGRGHVAMEGSHQAFVGCANEAQAEWANQQPGEQLADDGWLMDALEHLGCQLCGHEDDEQVEGRAVQAPQPLDGLTERH
jgi:hypothetical protein